MATSADAGALADLAEPLDPALQGTLALLQRQVKNGLTETAAQMLAAEKHLS